MFYEMINNSDALTTVAKQTANVATQGTERSLDKVSFDLSAIGSQGVVISIIGYVIVFIALVALFFFVKEMAVVLSMKVRTKLKSEGKPSNDKKGGKTSEISGEVAAAIAAAINLHYQEAHDIEATVLTIDKVQRRYSPWSSKLHGIRQYPTRR